LALLDRVRAGAVLRFQHPDISGLFLVGCRDWGQPPNDEDLHALSLLVEQFGVTLHNSQLQALQAAAEHQLAQQQKLSALGLLASSLAHEIKNPLSSIKTITRVMSEELGADSRHAEDLRMIGGEIDRLSQSTSELLESARPPRGDGQQMPLELLLSPTIRLLQHLAREYRSTLDVRFPDQLVFVPDDQVGLREIVFNLVSNGLDAARGGGTVCLTCRRESPGLCIDVHDTGVGIAGEQLHKLFEPFQTTKLTGTGLGLYVVARRVREMGGTIECRSVPGSTTFELRLPLGNPS
jgi:signal transduction histidine kinase